MKHYVILLNYSSGTSRWAAVEAKLNEVAPDWMRFGAGQYFVATEHQYAEPIYDALKPLLADNDYILVVEVTLPNRRGWAMPVVVDWVDKHGS